MSGLRYPRVNDGEWVRPRRSGYKMMCCDCGLVHRIDFRLVPWVNGGRKIILRASRDERATAASRRHRKGLRVPK